MRLLNDQSDTISPLLLGKSKDCDDFKLDGSPRVSTHTKKPKQRPNWLSHNRLVSSPKTSPALPSSTDTATSSVIQATPTDDVHQAKAVVAQAWEWLHAEKQKRKLRKCQPQASRDGLDVIKEDTHAAADSVEKARRDSGASDTSTALDQLEEILRKDNSINGIPRRSSTRGGRKRSNMLRASASSLRPRRHSGAGASSDTDHVDSEISVPTCETWLDNSKTLTRTTGLASLDENGVTYSRSMSQREIEAWSNFQCEILKIAHTLQLKRWRRVPLERSDDIIVERLSGALTNAVYTVSPPRDFYLSGTSQEHGEGAEPSKQQPRAAPGKLLLRIYGPQVEHLIDRDAELQILRRLGRQNIGPRLLGTFNNGRFEEYLHAKPLQPAELREPSVSRQIAKRMRELHDGIELTYEERSNGPFVWHNWEKWLDRCARIVSYIDGQVLSGGPASPAVSRLRNRGFVCGTSWDVFRNTVEKFRKELQHLYGGPESLKRELVFSHNDTQYGNILRQEPPGESPLLHPANLHKQLVVIDFEYSNANTRGLEFANHFVSHAVIPLIRNAIISDALEQTEWCYNYHDPDLSFDCQTSNYPTPEEQRRFLRAYLEHKPQFTPAVTTPRLGLTRGSISSIASALPSARSGYFSAADTQRSESYSSTTSQDGITPMPLTESMSALNLARTESQRSDKDDLQPADLEARATELMQETRLWRIANSAQWMAWGIVQARVPGLNSQPHAQIVKDTATEWTESPGTANEGSDVEEEDIEFDYLSYARSRALFFWGDCVQHGLIKKDDLPRDVQDNLKIVNY
ncbi:MAG: hypothetical protein Q9162_002819 [Coniocarpon cinnabarinum]